MLSDQLFNRVVKNQDEFNEFIKEANLKSKNFIIKPNWYDTNYAEFTEAKALEKLIKSLDGKITVVEGYSPRCRREANKESGFQLFYYTHTNQQTGTLWWSNEDKKWLRKADEEFLRKEGFQQLFDDYNVDYVNVTEEVWAGDTVDKDKIKKLVESKYSPVCRSELYQWVPKRLFELKDQVMISFAKIKGIEPIDSSRMEYRPSLALKCMFGMIPHPQRTNFHGLNNCELDQNIVDINKIYDSIFNLVGINEGLYTCMVSDPNGQYKADWGGAYDVICDSGLVIFGGNLTHLDAYTCKLISKDPEKVPYLKLAKEVFGEWDKKFLDSTKPQFKVKYKGSNHGSFVAR
jgi:uncharacterized protein (DUF362 family)